MSPSHKTSYAPARSSAPPRRSLRPLTLQPGFRVKLRPRRDALTRVRHDLRSLLQSVIGYADLLAEPRYGSLSREQARFVDNVRASASQLHELVDTCIELSRPDNDNGRAPSLPNVPLGESLERVRNTLRARKLRCELSVPHELTARWLSLDVSVLERAFTSLAGVLSRDGVAALSLRAEQVDGGLCLTLLTDGASATELGGLELLEDQLGNRDFVRLKLAEVLLARLGFTTRIAASSDYAELTLPL